MHRTIYFAFNLILLVFLAANLIDDLGSKAGSLWGWFHLEDVGYGRRQIGKGIPHADVNRLFHRPPADQNRHIFAGVIGTGRGGIVAVIGREDQYVIFGQSACDFRQAAVKFG